MLILALSHIWYIISISYYAAWFYFWTLNFLLSICYVSHAFLKCCLRDHSVHLWFVYFYIFPHRRSQRTWLQSQKCWELACRTLSLKWFGKKKRRKKEVWGSMCVSEKLIIWINDSSMVSWSVLFHFTYIIFQLTVPFKA